MSPLAAEFRASVRAETLKLRKRPSTWIICLIAFLYVALLDYLLTDVVVKTAPRRAGLSTGTLHSLINNLYPANFVRYTLSDVVVIGAALALILGALAMSSEYDWRTLRTALTQGPGRLTVLIAKVAVLIPLTGVISVLFMGAGALSSLVVGSLDGHLGSWPALSEVIGGFLATWLILSVWLVLGLFLGALLRQTATAIAGGLVYAIVVEGLILGLFASNGVIEAIKKIFPGANAKALSLAFGKLPTAAATPLVGAGQAVAVLFGYLLLFVALSALLLRRRDVAG